MDGEGAPIGEVLTWYGPHGAQERDQLAGERGAQAVAGLDPSFSVCKLAWLRRHRPGELARARTWTDLSGFVAAQLLGGGLEGVRVDLSHASRTGLLDLGGRAWDRAVLDQLSLGDLPLPPLTPSGTMIGEGVVSGATTTSAAPTPPACAAPARHSCQLAPRRPRWSSPASRPAPAWTAAAS